MPLHPSDWRNFALMTIPCLVIGAAGFFWSIPPAHEDDQPYIVSAQPPARRKGFFVQIKQFQRETRTAVKGRTQLASLITVQSLCRNQPSLTRRYFCHRLLSVRNGKSKVLWTSSEEQPNRKIDVLWSYTGGNPYSDSFRIKPGTWKSDGGDLVFLWDALVQPVKHRHADYQDNVHVSLRQLNRLAKQGGLRESRRFVIRQPVQPPRVNRSPAGV